MKEQILAGVEQMIARDAYLLQIVKTLPPKDQAEFLPLVIDSIEKTRNIKNNLYAITESDTQKDQTPSKPISPIRCG